MDVVEIPKGDVNYHQPCDDSEDDHVSKADKAVVKVAAVEHGCCGWEG